MNIISMAVVGLIVGILSRFFYPGAVPMGLIVSMLLGIAGSFLAGFLGTLIYNKGGGSGFSRAGFICSILGAMILIFLARNVFHLV